MSNGPDQGVLHGTEFASDPVSTQAVNEIPVGDRMLFAVSDGFLVMGERFLERDLELHGGGAVGCHFPELKVARALTR
jgi:hypothetical protein